ncbi:MAG: tRNA uridine-5-carboxymethylaminomethyl(34) synthesis enzyme MnmG, partial [Firmicutes bacterium]|nr:tRNA uridine-5-carboxymethylaminomethyl(34) synthesis enzyme MnmG [Bacillota bacterium]
MKKAKEIKTDYDCIVIGAGHAGCEASLASARLGCKTLVVTMNLDSIAFLACNPSIGGTAKGHLVCEIDALGGQMGIIADATALQIKMLNTSNGPAVHSLRAQSDKYAYHTQMKKVLEAQENLHIKQGEIISIKQIEEINLWQATLATGLCYTTKTIVVATGVYLNSRILMGSFTKNIGPNGFEPSTQFTQSLEALGYTIRRFKTGTPCRVAGKSIDFSKTQIQSGDDNLPYSFSALSTTPPKNVANCYLTYTNPKTHKIIQDNITKSPMYNGLVKGTGARYCPSIEDKITRFADKDRHQVFLEPEGAQSDEIYLQGISTSLPVDVQEQFVKSIVGLEKAQIMRNAYAIEYDCIDSLQLYPTLQSKMHAGLFFAGQINGTSGYEEAAAQGLIAGLNAALTVKGKPLYTPTRDTSYIGVLIDDLTTKGTNEPY